MIKVDISKVNIYVIPSLDKAFSLIEEGYTNSVNLKSIIPSNSIEINKISEELNEIKYQVNNLKKKLENKISEIKKIEDKNNRLQNNFFNQFVLNSINKKNTEKKYTKFKILNTKIVKSFYSIFNNASKTFSHVFTVKKNSFFSVNASFYNNVKTKFSYQQLSTNKDSLSEYRDSKLNELKLLALKDTQIDTSGKFENYTDFQNIMLSDLSLIELLWDGDEKAIAGKTIGELYKESLKTELQENIEYDKLVFDEHEMLEMSKSENREKYRTLVLGKLVRYGFSDMKIKRKVSGKDCFDAFLIEDTAKNQMVYFPCTNLVETDDFLYDAYPIMDEILNDSKFIGDITGAKKIFESQQLQAELFLEECIKNCPDGIKISVSGFSLGGSLAEHSYLSNYKKYADKLKNIILYNPYHNRLSDEEANILKSDNKLKLYVCEGDAVSTVFNYENFADVAKPVYIHYQNSIATTAGNVDIENSVLNKVTNQIKQNFCSDFIESCENLKNEYKYNIVANLILSMACESAKLLKKSSLDSVKIIQEFNSIIKKISPIFKLSGVDIYKKYDLEFLNNLQYLETIFTSIHLTYAVDTNKNNSFDENGNIKTSVNIDDQSYNVGYPSFDDVSSDIFGSEIYSEVESIVGDLNL